MMSEQFAMALLAKLIENLEERVAVLEDMMTEAEDDEPQGQYMDGTPIQ